MVLECGFGEWIARPYFSFIIVNPKGTKKSHAIQSILVYMFDLDREEEIKYRIAHKQYTREMENARKSKTISYLRNEPIRKRYYITDITIEQLCRKLEDNPQGLLWYSDEIAGLIKGLNQYKGKGNDVERFIDALDGRSFPVNRKDFDLYVHKPFVCALGTTQRIITAKCTAAN